jgi:16S rRNA A1518/A1519 N6-dimethyltransferase RsmA/KsgA/DIM1 with predicted DNA glycosylase/AP lyase activity
MAQRPTSTLWRTQNFLRRTTPIERLIARSGLDPSDVVYDIGAGAGVLTALLSRRVGRVIAIEKDEALFRQLKRRFADRPNVTVRHADFMEYRLPRAPYKVVANPPFDITAAVVTKLTSAATPPDDVFLALQAEAADRYCGQPRETLVSLLIAPFFEATIVHRFRREDFVPIPGVDIVMLRLRKRGPPSVGHQHRQLYRDFVVAGFTAWRPSIGGALARRLGSRVTHRMLAAVQLHPDRRPSDVSFATWLRLFETFSHLPPAILGRVSGAEDRLSRQQRRLEKRHRTRAARRPHRRATKAAS